MNRDELRVEILRFLDGDLSPEEERALAGRIRGDREAEVLFAGLMRVHGNIPAALSESEGQKSAEREMGGLPRARRIGRVVPPQRSSIGWVAAGVAAAVFILLALLASDSGSAPPRVRPLPTAREKTPPEPVPPPPPIPEVPAPPREPALPVPAPLPKKEPVAPAPLEVPRPGPEAPRPVPPPPAVPQAPPEPPAPRTTKVETAVATLQGVKGDVQVRIDQKREPAREGQTILAAQGVETGAGEASASLLFTDGTRVDLTPETRIDGLSIAEGKKVALAQGQVSVDAKKQPPGQPLLVTTPHAEVRVLGTKFTVVVKADGTRLEVQEGRVRMTRLPDQASTDVVAGFFAVAAPGTRPAAKRLAPPNPRLLLSEDFEAATGFENRWQVLSDGFPSTVRGKLEIDLSPRPADPYAAGGWHAPGGLRSKQSFAVPFRMTVDVEVTARHDNLNALVALVPASVKAGAVKNEIAVRLRGAEYAILVENNKLKTAAAAGPWPLRSRWTVELDRQEVRFWVGDKEIGRAAHGLTLTEETRFELQGAAKVDVPAGAHVSFDTVKVEPLEK